VAGAIELLAYGGGGGPSIGTILLIIGAIVVLGLLGLMLAGPRR
jgi:hypothetical protein